MRSDNLTANYFACLGSSLSIFSSAMEGAPKKVHGAYWRIRIEVDSVFRTEIDATRATRVASRVALPQPLAPVALDGLVTNRIDKSELAIAEPKRRRDKAHLKFVASQPCLVCGRQPSDPHYLRFAQPRAIGLKVSDEFTVPLCRGHHRQLHQAGNEEAWWAARNIGVLAIAKDLWAQTRPTI